jgi:hypothetical protein
MKGGIQAWDSKGLPTGQFVKTSAQTGIEVDYAGEIGKIPKVGNPLECAILYYC